MKNVNRLLAGVAAAAMLTAPVAAADFGYDMGLEQDAKTYGGLYYSIPFQGATKRDTREGTTMGFQVDHKVGTSIDPFGAPAGFKQEAMFDVSFDSTFTLNKMLVNGIDTVSMYDQLNANGDNDDRLGGYLPLIAVAIVVGGAIWAANQDDDNDQCPSEGGEGGEGGEGPSSEAFTDVRYMEGGSGGAYSCDDRYEGPKYELKD